MLSAKTIPNHEQSLLESKAFEAIPSPIVILDSSSKVVFSNPAFSKFTGIKESETQGCSLVSLLKPSTRGESVLHLRALTLEMLQDEGTFEDIAVTDRANQLHIVDLTVAAFESSRVPFRLAQFKETTEKRKLQGELLSKHQELRNTYGELEKANAELKSMQDALVQAGKMAALGELSAGIAHELNQPLQVIKGFSQEVERIVGGSHAEARDSLTEINRHVDKMAKIIQSLRSFVSQSAEGMDWVDVKGCLDEALSMLSRQFKSRGIEVIIEVTNEIPKVYAHATQLEQVFLNLATNARDAIEATGRGKGEIQIKLQWKAPFVELSFKDNGTGMNEKTKSKAFNPFFTTKEVGKGMGLGLSLSFGILNKIHGSILVESEWGKGSEFLIRIPKDYREIG